MLSDLYSALRLFPEAALAGIIIGCTCGALGIFVILKRVVFIGLALPEVAACGIAFAITAGIPPVVGAGVLTLAAVTLLAYPFENARIPRDSVLGAIFALTAGLAVLLVARSGFGLQEVRALLYGDLILTSRGDLALICALLPPALLYFLVTLRPTLYTFLDREGARVMGMRVSRWELGYFCALGIAVSAASKVAGALLVFCYLTVIPSLALLVTRRLTYALIASAACATLLTLAGLAYSFSRDLPVNQVISVMSCLAFMAALGLRFLWMHICRLQAARRGEAETREGASAIVPPDAPSESN